MSDIRMPQLSDSMEHGTIGAWLKADGDQIEVGDDIAEIETDKATMAYEAPLAGVLTILVHAGVSVAVGTPIARVDGSARALGPGLDEAADTPQAAHARTTDVAEVGDADHPAPALAPAGSGVRNVSSDSGSFPRSGRATPLARRVAGEYGVDLQSVVGTGPNCWVRQADVLRAASQADRPPASRRSTPELAIRTPSAPGSPEDVDRLRGSSREHGPIQKLTRVQELIARRMTQTNATVPDFQVQTEAAVSELLALRARMRNVTREAPSVNDFIVKAAALALTEFPLVNGMFVDGNIELNQMINIGVAVATEGALVVPTVTAANARSLGSIAAEVRRLAAAVRDGTVTPSELSGATFTVSNLGMYGMTAITPIINAPQAAILGVGAARSLLAKEGDDVVERQVITLTLSCDHRILYGAEASSFLSRVRELLEQPLRLAI